MRLEVRLAIVSKILGVLVFAGAVGWLLIPGSTPAPQPRIPSARQVAIGGAREVFSRADVSGHLQKLSAGMFVDRRDLMSLEVHVWDLARRPIAGAEVVAMHGEEVLARGTSASDGVATLLVPVLPTHVTAHTEDGREGVDDANSFQVDETNSRAFGVHITLIDVATLSGRVIDKNGEGIEGATIALVDASEFLAMSRTAVAHEALRSAPPFAESNDSLRPLAVSPADATEVLRTDALGEFALPIRAEGLWMVAAQAEGYSANASQSVQLTSGASARVELTLIAGHFFAGRVVDTHGAGVPSAAVSLHPASGFVQSVSTAENGTFRFAGTETNEARIEVAAAGFVDLASVAVPDSVNEVYELERGATLRVDVSAPVVEERMVSAQVACVRDGRELRRGISGSLDAAGHTSIVLTGLQEGASCSVEVRGLGLMERIANVNLDSAETTVYVDANGRGGLRGRVLLPPSYDPSVPDPRPVIVSTIDESLVANADGTFHIGSESVAGVEIHAQWLDEASGIVYGGHVVAGSDGFVTIRLEDEGERWLGAGDGVSHDLRQACAHPVCDSSVPFQFADGAYVVPFTDTQHFAINLVAGDVFVDAQGRPLSVSDLDLIGPCRTSVRLYLSRPSTRERLSFQAERDVEAGCADVTEERQNDSLP